MDEYMDIESYQQQAAKKATRSSSRQSLAQCLQEVKEPFAITLPVCKPWESEV